MLVPLVKKFVDDVLKTIVPARKTSKAETGEEKEAENEEGASQQRHCSYTPKSVSALAKNYGLLCHALERKCTYVFSEYTLDRSTFSGYLSFKQKRWFIERFCELASVGADEGSSEDSVNNNGYESSKMVSAGHSFPPHRFTPPSSILGLSGSKTGLAKHLHDLSASRGL